MRLRNEATSHGDQFSRDALGILVVVGMMLIGACGASHTTGTETKRPAAPHSVDADLEDDPEESAGCHGPPLEGEAAIKTIEEAERLLESGAVREAGILLQAHVFADDLLQTRANFDLSVVSFRFAFDDQALRAKTVGHQISWLERHLADDPDNAVIIARLAEGYAISPETRVKAKGLLEDLAQRDLVPDAFAYATLAQLRANLGEEAGAREALATCKKLASRAGICTQSPKEERRPNVSISRDSTCGTK